MQVVFDKDFSIGEYHWNHRVVRRVFPNGEVSYAILEAHYKQKGATAGPCSLTLDPIAPSAEDIEGLRWVLQKMLEALSKPILDYETGEECISSAKSHPER